MDRASKLVGSHFFFFREGDTINSAVATASRARASNIATIVTDEAHGLWTGAIVTIASMGAAAYDASLVTVTVVNATTFTYANTGADEATTADTAGTVTMTGTASATLKPGPNDGGWIEVGTCEECTVSKSQEDIELWGPSPGKLVLQELLEIKSKLTLKFTVNQLSALVIEVLYQADELDSTSTQFNPLGGSQKRGWIKMEQYGHDDALVLVLDVWCRIRISGDVNFGGTDAVKPQFEAFILDSRLNTGTLE